MIERRRFLQWLLWGAVGGWWSGVSQKARGQLLPPPPLVAVVDSEIVQREDLIDRAVLRAMLEEGLQAAVQARSAVAAWKHLVQPNDVVAVKVSAQTPSLSVHHALIDEIVRGLLTADVPPENILIWDRRTDDLERWGYVPKPVPELGFPEPVGTLLAAEGPESPIRRVGYDPNAGFESDEDLPARRDVNGIVSRFTYIVTELATKIIVVPVLQYHPITGIFGTMASLAFGALNNTFRFHPSRRDGIPIIADIWRESVFPKKHVLTIVDALTGAYHTGPGYDPRWFWQANRLLISQDPVAVDTVALELINEQRKPPLDPVTEREVAYLRRAASYGLGAHAADRIERVERTVE